MRSLRKPLLVLLFSATSLFPLSAKIEWLSKNYNYGVIKEIDGPQRGSVSFVNRGEEETFINNVRPGCGCTEVEFTQGMIQPGDTATVSFTYNPKGRPGSFDKNVRVFVGSGNDMHTVKLTGTVIGSPSTLEFGYPKEVGPLRLESFTAKSGELKKGSSRHLFINAYNQSPDTIIPVWNFNDKGLEIELTPRVIPPGDVATFGFYLKTDEEPRMGPVEYVIPLIADNNASHKDSCEIVVSTVIVPDTRKMTVAEVENAPRAYLLPEFIDFGETLDRDVVSFSFEILNDGGNDLEVLRVYSEVPYIKVKYKPTKIKSRKRQKIKGELDVTKINEGPFRLAVEVMTNDPLHPIRTANLVGVK